MTDHVLDLRDLKCPLPALRTRKALLATPPGGRLSVQCTDPLSRIDIPNLVRELGDVLVGIDDDGATAIFRIERAAR